MEENQPTVAGAGPRVVTFYSYKGGTGRTMALANMAWIIASNGLRVLAVDWDLEAPGLHRYFHPFLADSQLRTSRGIIDMIRDFATEATDLTGRGGSDWIAERAQVLQYAVSLRWTFPKPGVIDFLPAGVQDGSYSRSVSTFNWDAFYERLGGDLFLRGLRRDMLEHYDYVLIDSRTGLSDTSGICTVLMPDTVVNCFTVNTQSIDGAVAVTRYIVNQRRGRPIAVLPVPMRVDRRIPDKAGVSRAYARLRFGPFMRGRPAAELDRYWADVEIPYLPEYAHEEILAPFGDPGGAEDSLLAAFERLTAEVTGGRVRRLPPLDEGLRREWLARFVRPAPADSPAVLVGHAAIDRMWGEWLATELADAGMTTVRLEIDTLAHDLDGLSAMLAEVGRTVVVLSQESLRFPVSAHLWNAVMAQENSGVGGMLVAVRVDSAVLSEPFTDRLPVELGDLAEDRARDLLLAAIGPPPGSELPPASADAGSWTGERLARPRFPLSVPSLWRAPKRDPAFVGRQLLFDELRGRLQHDQGSPPQVLVGPEWAGKTAIAMEYAHRFGPDYDLVWWISATRPHDVLAAFALLASKFALPVNQDAGQSWAAVVAALHTGRQYPRWLIVFDGAADPESVGPYVPAGPGHVLITSRIDGWAGKATIQVGAFSRDESVAFLQRRIPGISDKDAHRLSEKLLDRPLELERAAAWLGDTGMPVAVYLSTRGD